ncbi:MAG: molybdate ABC transporter permease subunit [Actinomycetia bacterium]|nr:molybdate ABC transporter permease subunit [Actinomycetes bacterium]
MRRALFPIGLAVSLALAFVFLTLPVAAVFLRASPVELVRQLGSELAVDAMLVTLQTSTIALALILVVGTPAAYALARWQFRGRSVVVALTELPLVLPPAVAGIGLLAALGTRGLLGGTLDAFGVRIPFTQAAVILAVTFVASPFYLRQALVALEALDPDVLDAARTLGASPARVFRRIVLPLSGGALGAGATLAWARGIGEFGATILFAGSLQGETQTLPLAIYAAFDLDRTVALALGALLIIISLAVLLTAKLLPSWTRSSLTSASSAARSTSM